jgi:hypothetical protein
MRRDVDRSIINHHASSCALIAMRYHSRASLHVRDDYRCHRDERADGAASGAGDQAGTGEH